MVSYNVELTIDFGVVGYRNNQERFCVRLDASNLMRTIEDARNAHRIYELLLIDRAGDVWDYVAVVVESVPSSVSHRIEAARKKSQSVLNNDSWPKDKIPFTEFDDLFYWAFDDTPPEDEAWLKHRNADAMKTFVQHLLAIVRNAVSTLDWNDELRSHVIERIRLGNHPFSFLQRSKAIEAERNFAPNIPEHTPSFYQKLQSLLRDSDIVSVAYRGTGDYSLLRMLATEQRRRANLTGHTAENALHLSALVNRQISNEAWDSKIWLFSEGLAHGDLFIQGIGLDYTPCKELIEVHGRDPGRYLFSTKHEGNIAGFDVEAGDGWVLYRKQMPDSRRRALERIAIRRPFKSGVPLLRFGEAGTSVFTYDKALLIIGASITRVVRDNLAALVADWEANGGDPVLIVYGDKAPFELHGCRHIFVPPEISESGSTTKQKQWLWDLLKCRRPWLDVLISLEAPAWFGQFLEERILRKKEPWSPWIVTTAENENLHADFVIKRDLQEMFNLAIVPRMTGL